MSSMVMISPRQGRLVVGVLGHEDRPLLQVRGREAVRGLDDEFVAGRVQQPQAARLDLHDLGHGADDVVEDGAGVERGGEEPAGLREKSQFVDVFAQEGLLVADPRERVGEELEERDGVRICGLGEEGQFGGGAGQFVLVDAGGAGQVRDTCSRVERLLRQVAQDDGAQGPVVQADGGGKLRQAGVADVLDGRIAPVCGGGRGGGVVRHACRPRCRAAGPPRRSQNRFEQLGCVTSRPSASRMLAAVCASCENPSWMAWSVSRSIRSISRSRLGDGRETQRGGRRLAAAGSGVKDWLPIVGYASSVAALYGNREHPFDGHPRPGRPRRRGTVTAILHVLERPQDLFEGVRVSCSGNPPGCVTSTMVFAGVLPPQRVADAQFGGDDEGPPR